MIKTLKKTICSFSSIYTYDSLLKKRHCVRNKVLLESFQPIWSINPIDDFPSFKDAVVSLKARFPKYANWLERGLFGGESLFYGHLKALADYAGIPYEENLVLRLPAIEHGIYWLNEPSGADDSPQTHNIVSQGNYRHDAIRQYQRKPHFVIGPYVHYASGTFEQDEIISRKKTLGRTALVFPAHAFESSSNTYDRKRYVNGVMDSLRDHFDSVLISCYWNDINDQVYRYFEDAGAQIISSGLRSDPRFINRLRSIMELSDVVYGNSLGTHIGYSLYLEKPFVYFDGMARVAHESDSTHAANANRFATGIRGINDEMIDLFSLKNDGHSVRIEPEQTEFLNHYWGTEKSTKTPEEIKAIFDITNDMLEQTNGKVRLFNSAYSRLLQDYQASHRSEDAIRAAVLQEALG